MSKFPTIQYRVPNHYDSKAASDEVAISEWDESLTVQSMTEDADINVIVKRFGLTGQMPADVRPVFYGDFDSVLDFRTAQDAIRSANENFLKMPAEVRSRFGNDPQQFLEFCSATDDGKTLKNIDELRRLGLAIPKEEAIITPAPEGLAK